MRLNYAPLLRLQSLGGNSILNRPAAEAVPYKDLEVATRTLLPVNIQWSVPRQARHTLDEAFAGSLQESL